MDNEIKPLIIQPGEQAPVFFESIDDRPDGLTVSGLICEIQKRDMLITQLEDKVNFYKDMANKRIKNASELRELVKHQIKAELDLI